tara:strand:+ start:509 stop:1123 length:615 start_codon:yes stop_codon:yes gene_type:complete
MGLISNGTTIFDAGSMAAGLGASMTFIKKLTASSSANLAFVNGSSNVVLDSTYKEYIFTFKDIHPQTDSKKFRINFSTDGGSNYGVTTTSTAFFARHNEGDTNTALSYDASFDLGQSANPQNLNNDVGNDNDQCDAGMLHLFNPASTTFVKHFTSRVSTTQATNYHYDMFYAGYVNTTSAITAVKFDMASGNIDAGDICLYGIS